MGLFRLPFFSGGTLDGLVARRGAGQGLPLPTITSYLQQMLAAVLHLKKMGLAHRDVKLDNILLAGPPDKGGCPADVALGDFGECGPLVLSYMCDGSVSRGGAAIALVSASWSMQQT